VRRNEKIDAPAVLVNVLVKWYDWPKWLLERVDRLTASPAFHLRPTFVIFNGGRCFLYSMGDIVSYIQWGTLR